MAVPQNTLIGKTRQSVGNVTFTTWKGINVIKSKPVSVADPRTQTQLDQRQKLSNFVEFYRLNSAIFNAGFKQMAVGMSAYNAAASVNMKNGSISDQPNTLLDNISMLEVAKGSLYPTEIATAEGDFSSKLIHITWSNINIADQLNSDKPYILCLAMDGSFLAISTGTGSRSDGDILLTANDMPATSSQFLAFLFFVQSSSGKVSDSYALSAFVVA